MKKPSDISQINSGIFGLNTNYNSASVIVLPVPWEVTTSFRRGTKYGPLNTYKTSSQIDLFDEDLGNIWEKGIYMVPFEDSQINNWSQINDELSELSDRVIQNLESGASVESQSKDLEAINKKNQTVFSGIETACLNLLKDNKCVVGLGGEHSITEPLIKAHATIHGTDIGVLQLDAHMDLRKRYEGFNHSHASVIHNVLEKQLVSSVVQVGVRDFSEDEWQYANGSDRISVFTDRDFNYASYKGTTWADYCENIVSKLPEKVYVTFDIDALKPELCPQTGTPVPGGLDLDRVFYLLDIVATSGRRIIGADLVEVGGEANSVDTIVASHALYRLIAYLSPG